MPRANNGVHFSTTELSKPLRHGGVLTIVSSKRASGHNGVHFFDMSTSKNAPTMGCFNHFDFPMCFTSQPHAPFSPTEFPKPLQHLRCFGNFCFQMCFAPQRHALLSILTSKSAPTMRCFYPFDFQTRFTPQPRASFCPKPPRRLRCFDHFCFDVCFAPQRRALFEHLNFQKCSTWSDNEVI